jgi:Flp pilus assembly protein TadG
MYYGLNSKFFRNFEGKFLMEFATLVIALTAIIAAGISLW